MGVVINVSLFRQGWQKPIVALGIVGLVFSLGGMSGYLFMRLAARAKFTTHRFGWSIPYETGLAGLLAEPFKSSQGPLALWKGEVVYGFRVTDDEGLPLEAGCDYQVEGNEILSAWWSLVVYDAEGYLPQHDHSAYSLTNKHFEMYPWKILLSKRRPEANHQHWIALPERGRFEVLLRIYGQHLDPKLLGDTFPRIKRVRCDRAI